MLPESFYILNEIFNEDHPLNIQFTDKIESPYNYPESGMLAELIKIKIVSVGPNYPIGSEDICVLTFNFKPYREYNKKLESPDYPLPVSLSAAIFGTATEAGAYKDINFVQVNPNDNPNNFFTPYANPVFEVFMEQRNKNETYSQWLERIVIESKILDKRKFKRDKL